MKLLEYEAKHILAAYDIPVPRSFIANDKPDFLPVVIKSQVPVGGRGKTGGVVKVTTPDEFSQAFQTISRLEIKEFRPKKLLAEELIDISRELYLTLLIDKQNAQITLMAHTRGGVEVEENDKDSYLKLVVGSWEMVDRKSSSFDEVGQKLAEYYDLPEKEFLLGELAQKLYDCFVKNDAVLLEINPLILTNDGTLVAGDCKMELDDAASFRHADWNFEKEQTEANFVTLDEQGNVATIANGAGLAMATVDAVADAGLNPANFLDIGGGANEASVLAAFERIMEYPNVNVIIINIFAGITRCDEIAKAVIAARARIDNLPPLYIRLAGTNFEQAVTLLAHQDIPTLATLDECIQAAKENRS